jgi:hypothetical protein
MIVVASVAKAALGFRFCWFRYMEVALIGN